MVQENDGPLKCALEEEEMSNSREHSKLFKQRHQEGIDLPLP
jgi:hypothetical protein